ncbi:MAG: hypothetical protein WDO73_31345 [Ignavibacteriota bacterium]
MAEVYSTLQEQDGKLVLGEMKRDRIVALGSGNWMRLPEVAARRRQVSAVQRSGTRVDVLRAELPPGAHAHAGRRICR